MSEPATFVAEPRETSGKGAIRTSRANGHIPGVIYGGKEPPQLITLPVKQLLKEHQSGKMMSRMCFVDVGGKKTRVLAREVQVDPVRDDPVHVDFLRVPKGARISLAIPVEFKNLDQSPGIKRGGALNIVRHEVELYVNAEEIPDHLEVDLTGLEINDSVHISAVTLPAGTKPKITRDFTIATIAPSSGYAAEQAEAAAKAAEAAGMVAAGGVPAEGAEGAPAAPGAEGAAPEAGKEKAAPEAGKKETKKK